MCSGCRGQIAGSSVYVLVGEDGEGDGFLGVGIDAVVGGGGDFDGGEERAKAAHQVAVVNASAGGDYFSVSTAEWLARWSGR